MKLLKVKRPLTVVETDKGWACPKCKAILSRVGKIYSYEHCMYCGVPLSWERTPFIEYERFIVED